MARRLRPDETDGEHELRQWVDKDTEAGIPSACARTEWNCFHEAEHAVASFLPRHKDP